jgi:hypothetical protein
MTRDQRAKTLWRKRVSKKRKPAKSEFPSLAGFYFTLSSNGGYHVKRTSKVVQRSKGLWIY